MLVCEEEEEEETLFVCMCVCVFALVKYRMSQTVVFRFDFIMCYVFLGLATFV